MTNLNPRLLILTMVLVNSLIFANPEAGVEIEEFAGRHQIFTKAYTKDGADVTENLDCKNKKGMPNGPLCVVRREDDNSILVQAALNPSMGMYGTSKVRKWEVWRFFQTYYEPGETCDYKDFCNISIPAGVQHIIVIPEGTTTKTPILVKNLGSADVVKFKFTSCEVGSPPPPENVNGQYATNGQFLKWFNSYCIYEATIVGRTLEAPGATFENGILRGNTGGSGMGNLEINVR